MPAVPNTRTASERVRGARGTKGKWEGEREREREREREIASVARNRLMVLLSSR